MKNQIIKGDCMRELKKLNLMNHILVIDPPFNIKYHYERYDDNKPELEYLDWIKDITSNFDEFVLIHYPEMMFKIANHINKTPKRIVNWVYNSNTKRQSRMIAFFGVSPDFSKVKQPYKNPNDKRIKQLIAEGSKGTNLYDWWNINQVKNVSKEKTKHPCQMPLKVMENIIGILPTDKVIVDCFMGSGTTGVACKHYNRKFVGIELNPDYCKIAEARLKPFLEQERLQ